MKDLMEETMLDPLQPVAGVLRLLLHPSNPLPEPSRVLSLSLLQHCNSREREIYAHEGRSLKSGNGDSLMCAYTHGGVAATVAPPSSPLPEPRRALQHPSEPLLLHPRKDFQ